MENELFAGFHCIDITPERPCHMAGYSRTHMSESVLDPIQVNALSFKTCGESFILCVLDSIILEETFCDEVKRAITERCGILADHISVSCIHTHSAPAFFKLAFEDTHVEPQLTAQARQALIDAGAAAYENMQPATVSFEKMDVEGLYGNRNNIDGPAVKTCYLARFLGKEGDALGAFFNISAHPTILNGSSLALSADLIGQVRLRLERELGCTVVCTNGTCGDVSTRFYRTASGMEELMGTADALFEQIMAKKQPVALQDSGSATPLCRRISVPSVYDASTDPDWAAINERLEREGDQMPAGLRDLIRSRQRIKLEQSPVHLNLVSQIYIFGSLIVVTLPGDICSELGLRIKRAFPTYEVVNVGYSNAYCNYLVPEEDYGKYFETFNARTARGVPDAFIQEIIATIESMISEERGC